LNIGTEYLNTGIPPKRYGNEHPNLVPYQSFKTKDDSIIIAVGNDKHFKIFCDILELSDLAEDERYKTVSARSTNRRTLLPIIQDKLLEQSADYWVDLFREKGIASGPINTVDKVFTDPQVIARDMVTEIDHPVLDKVKLISSPLKLSDTPTEIKKYPPQPGEHTEDILKELNYNEDQIKSFLDNGIV